MRCVWLETYPWPDADRPDFSWAYEGQSTSHIVSRSVRDSAAMLDATEGAEPGSAYVAPGPTGFLSSLDDEVGQLRCRYVDRPDGPWRADRPRISDGYAENSTCFAGHGAYRRRDAASV